MPEKWRIPPRIKVLEAAGAIADGRVRLVGEMGAEVRSSDGTRVYKVRWDGGRRIVSDDNGSVYRGYLGYPSIALLMLKGLLPLDERVANALRGVPWKRLNEKYRKYWVVERIVKNIAAKRGVGPEEVDAFVTRVMEEIKKAGFEKLR